MNPLIILNTNFTLNSGSRPGGSPSFPKGKKLAASHLEKLANELQNVEDFWERKGLDFRILSVRQDSIVAKSHRIHYLFGDNKDSLISARFVFDENDGDKQKHVFSYNLSSKEIKKAIKNLKDCAQLLITSYNSEIDCEAFEEVKKKGLPSKSISKSCFLNVLADCAYIEKFFVLQAKKRPQYQDKDQIISFFNFGSELAKVFQSLGVNFHDERKIDEYTYCVSSEDATYLFEEVPHLISMSVEDFALIPPDKPSEDLKPLMSPLTIPSPGTEPVVGVIDTHFSSSVYCHEWVEYHNEQGADIQLDSQDFVHGTKVSCLIVDGPSFNPQLDDGCGRFRVRHFGVSTAYSNSSFWLIKKIKEIVIRNRDIKVWNLSLGSPLEVDEFFISPEAEQLDKLQQEFGVIFCVAATNKPNGWSGHMRIGSPADSLNSLVVTGVNKKGLAASYCRSGPVLTFFYKPDVAAFGGDLKESMRLCSPLGEAKGCGTSFAAPWITRKLAFLVYKMNLSIEAAKALIIDAASGWKANKDMDDFLGFGVVPQNIKDILEAPRGEIKFLLEGRVKAYQTYTHKLPLPIEGGYFPFKARATLVYFPSVDRKQGVDYTLDELQLQIGPIKEKENKHGKVYPTIISINQDHQFMEGKLTSESKARFKFRKWDNTKRIVEKISTKSRGHKVEFPNWGIGVRAIGRLEEIKERNLKFAIVVSLKEVKGKDRYKEFLDALELSQDWTARQLILENENVIYAKSQEPLFDF